MTLSRKAVFNMIHGWVDVLQGVQTAEAIAKELKDVLYCFACYPRYAAKFGDEALTTDHNDGNNQAGSDRRPAATREDAASPGDAIDALKMEYKDKSSHVLIDCLFDLLATTHDKSIGDALKSTLMKDIDWSEDHELELVREILRLCSMHKTAMDLQRKGPPAAPRELARLTSDPGVPDEEEKRKERAEAWRQAQFARKKLVHVGHSRCSAKVQLQSYFEKTPIFNFGGKAGESHRLFIFSAELFAEARGSPWATHAEMSHATADVMLSWLGNQTGPTDVILLADGRSRACRKRLEKAAEDMRHLHEEWIIYRPTKRLGRRVAFGSDNTEMLLVSLLFPRTSMVAVPRSEYSGAGEESTHEATYTEVPPAPWGSLPVMSADFKETILGQPTEVPKDSVFDCALGVPLFWQERKTVQCWSTLFENHRAKAVFDLTPGSGAAARAAMDLGIQYACICRSAWHCSWLQNILDRQALRALCRNGSPLYQQDLAQCLEAQFKDTLAKLNEMDAAVEQEPMED